MSIDSPTVLMPGIFLNITPTINIPEINGQTMKSIKLLDDIGKPSPVYLSLYHFNRFQFKLGEAGGGEEGKRLHNINISITVRRCLVHTEDFCCCCCIVVLRPR